MMTVEDAERLLGEVFAPWVQALRLRVESIGAGEATLVLPFDPHVARIGGMVCGQAVMSAADTAMVFAVSSQFGELRPCTTVSLNTSFLRPVVDTDLRVVARVIKPGRNLMFGEVEMVTVADGKLAAHATTTYAML